MKRILFLAQVPPPVHGASIANKILISSDLIAEHFESRHIDIGAAGKIEDIGKFSVAKLPGVARTLVSIVRNLFVFRPHIVYLSLAPSGFAFYRDVVFVQIIRLFGPELVFHLHGKGLRRSGENSRLFRRLSKSIFKNCHVIFLSEGLRSDAAGLSYKSSFVVNYGFPEGPVAPRVASDGQKKIEILYLSNYVRTKGVIDLVDALELVSRTHNHFGVTLAGKPFDISLEFLENYVREKGLADRVRVCGPKYDGDKVELLEKADIFVLPTYYENEAFPLSILEAMKFGLPVISTYEGGIPDMIAEGVDGRLFPSRDITALARQIEYLLDHPEERRSLGEAARRKFLERFTVSTFERNMLQVFQHICPQEP
ncbi:glycosyltransferase family 4 protein [Puia dinghuensis]|uniref:Glycosyl transferase n=1 Tax=Puia dinghuensis TaxID=1792502 RepID=A0A8J2UED4_9BACT|nr:glycosyltransferase family 4 protein [Puia dinghuensis]GGB06364.1 glycosyl transferase [Puia dinghuensis]